MNPVPRSVRHAFRPQLLERRARLQAVGNSVPASYLIDLIAEVDAALGRIEDGSFGLCETCRDPIEEDRLEGNPLARFCLDHLSDTELRAHQEDLDLATQIQMKLLPPPHVALEAWDVQHRYKPVAAVGGDYCEVVSLKDGKSVFFAVGDVAGKGVAASLLMTHLSAIFRSLLSVDLALADLVSRANRLFCESTAPAHYATLVCGRATADGLQVCNAGHCPPLLFLPDGVRRLDSTGLPLGLFCGGQYTVQDLSLGPGETMVLYSDGITEAQNPPGDDYGEERLIRSVRDHMARGADTIVDAVLEDVTRFRGSRPQNDDITLLIVRRRG